MNSKPEFEPEELAQIEAVKNILRLTACAVALGFLVYVIARFA